MELLHDPGDGLPERILFPVYDRYNALYGFTGRAVDSRVPLRIKDYYGLPKRHLLLGAHLIHPEDEYVILVEGLVDYARMVTFDQPAMAFMSSTLTPMQAEIVKDIGKPVYLFHDNDKPGLDARDRAGELLWRHVPVMKVRYPLECTVETPEGDLRPPEDPAELSKKQVEEMLEDSRLL
jgi:DNA primase